MSALFRTTRAGEFDRLYRRHVATVYRYAFAVLGNAADAEDVTQQTFLNAYRSMLQGTKPRKMENWLVRIAHNEVRRHFRANGKAHEVEFDEQIAEAAPERNEPGLADVLRALQHLPPMQRSALVMREFEGRKYSEIADALGVTESALETLIFRARRGLAEQLEEALSCNEAEQALSRRLDGRLARREARRLRHHLHECARCLQFADVQKRQRSLLKGLSIMPIPASLMLFRGEPAAAGVAAGAAVGSTAVGGGGVATGLAAKAAAVAVTAAVAGGAGYGVATQVERSARPTAKVAAAAEPAAAARKQRAQPRPIVSRPTAASPVPIGVRHVPVRARIAKGLSARGARAKAKADAPRRQAGEVATPTPDETTGRRADKEKVRETVTPPQRGKRLGAVMRTRARPERTKPERPVVEKPVTEKPLPKKPEKPTKPARGSEEPPPEEETAEEEPVAPAEREAKK